MSTNLRENSLQISEENIQKYCRDQFDYSKLELHEFVHYMFKKYGIYIINNNSLYLNYQFSLTTFEILNEIIRGESLLNPVTEVDWAQMFVTLFACHAARTLGSHTSDSIEKAAIPHPKRGIKYIRVDSDNYLWKYMIPRALIIAEEISKEFRLINVNLVKNLILKADPFLLSKYQGRNFDILRSSLLIPMLSDPRLKYKALLLFHDFSHGGILEQLRIDNPEQLKSYICEDFWDSTYLQVFKGVQALEKTSKGKTFLSYLYANVVPGKDNAYKNFTESF